MSSATEELDSYISAFDSANTVNNPIIPKESSILGQGSYKIPMRSTQEVFELDKDTFNDPKFGEYESGLNQSIYTIMSKKNNESIYEPREDIFDPSSDTAYNISKRDRMIITKRSEQESECNTNREHKLLNKVVSFKAFLENCKTENTTKSKEVEEIDSESDSDDLDADILLSQYKGKPLVNSAPFIPQNNQSIYKPNLYESTSTLRACELLISEREITERSELYKQQCSIESLPDNSISFYSKKAQVEENNVEQRSKYMKVKDVIDECCERVQESFSRRGIKSTVKKIDCAVQTERKVSGLFNSQVFETAKELILTSSGNIYKKLKQNLSFETTKGISLLLPPKFSPCTTMSNIANTNIVVKKDRKDCSQVTEVIKLEASNTFDLTMKSNKKKAFSITNSINSISLSSVKEEAEQRKLDLSVINERSFEGSPQNENATSINIQSTITKIQNELKYFLNEKSKEINRTKYKYNVEDV